jgi:hypothetical protein
VILATSPLCWFHSEVALTTILDAMLTTATVLVCWLAIRRGGLWVDVAAMAFGFALVAANRPQTAAMLLPVWLYAFYRFRPPRGRRLLGGMLLMALFCTAWFVPMLAMSGGLDAYLECVAAKRHMGAQYTGLAGVLPLAFNVKQIALACWTGLVTAAVVAAFELTRWIVFVSRETKTRFRTEHREALRLLVLWLAPQVAFGLLIYTLMPGHVLSYLPALAILAALAMCRLGGAIGGRAGMTVIAGVVACANAAVFLVEPGGAVVLPLTAPRLRAHEEELARCFQAIRARYAPEQVVIFHGRQSFYWGFRHFMYYLPEYRNVLLTADETLPGHRARQRWVGQRRRTEFVDADRVKAPRQATLLLVVPPGERLGSFAPVLDVREARLVAGTAGTVYEVGLKP